MRKAGGEAAARAVGMTRRGRIWTAEIGMLLGIRQVLFFRSLLGKIHMPCTGAYRARKRELEFK